MLSRHRIARLKQAELAAQQAAARAFQEKQAARKGRDEAARTAETKAPGQMERAADSPLRPGRLGAGAGAVPAGGLWTASLWVWQ